MLIREATPDDHDALWLILEPILRAGDSYTQPPDMSRADALAYWLAPAHRTYVAQGENGSLLGTYYLRDNQAGPGNHVCNCGYMVSASASGKGVATALNAHSQDIARTAGYYAMQYNAVVSTNIRAIALWQRCGFEIIGTLKNGFDHPDHGYVDAYVMYKTL